MDGFIDKMKTNLGKAKDEAEKYSKIAIQKTSNLVSQTKYSLAVKSAEEKLVSIMAELGEYVYRQYGAGEQMSEDIMAKCQEAEELTEEIDSLKEKLADLKDAIICPDCNEYNPSDNIYCAKCGKKLKDDEE